MLLQYLPISAVNVADDSYRVTFAPQLEELKRSIKTIGLVQPISMRHTPEGTYQIVTGYKRVLVLQELGRQSVPALISEAKDLSPSQAFLQNLHDNAVTRQLNLIEKSMALHKLQQFYTMSEDDLVNQFLTLMDETPSYKVLHQLLSLEGLTEPMKHHIIQTDMALTTATRIAEFTSTTQQALLTVLKHIRPSTAKLGELLSLIREIAARDGVTVEEVLQRYQLLQVVTDPNASSISKVQALRQTLRGIRLEELGEKQQRLTQLIHSLHLPDKAKVVADPYFENQQIKLEYQFSAPEELGDLISSLKSAFDRQQWQKIFDWYRA